MRSVVYSAAERFAVQEVADRPLEAGELRLAVLASGVCGTDLHIHHGGFGATFPLTPGHEMVGEVVETGTGVDAARFAVGTRVAVDTAIPCGACEMCQRGYRTQCSRLRGYGLSIPGSAAEHVVVDAAKSVPLGSLDLETAVLAEPTACVVHGLDVLDLQAGAHVLVVGAGPTGQIFSQLVARGGAASVTVAGPTMAKLEIAVANGAHRAVATDRGSFAASRSALLHDHPDGFDAVIDATGSRDVIEHVLPLVRNGGTFLSYGMAFEDDRVTISPFEVFRRELTIKGSFSQTDCVSRAVDLLAGGVVVPDGIITHRFALDEYGRAMDAISDPDCVKAVVLPQGR